MKRARLLYGGIFFGCLIAALLYGDPFVFLTVYAFAIMFVTSFLLAVATLYGMRVHQFSDRYNEQNFVAKAVIIKGEPSSYYIRLNNRAKIGLGTMRFTFLEADFAVKTPTTRLRLDVRPFMKPMLFPMEYTVMYRGTYQIGLESIEVIDFLGLFRLKRKLNTRFEVIAYPKVTEPEEMRLAMHMLSKAPAQLAMAQEDYADFTDVRPYQPADPMKKIHWKLTAKRNEWIVKNYQSTVLNSITVLLDAHRRNLSHELLIKLEDLMAEYAVAITRYCLRNQMPVDFIFGAKSREKGKHIGDFEALYSFIAHLEFSDKDVSAKDALNHYLNENMRSVNVVLLTSILDSAIYERIIEASRFGHYIAVVYFVPKDHKTSTQLNSDEIFEHLQGSGINCVKMVTES
ncbi:MAG: DUF58 domain-containing protein [Turicibacter sp.]|nr:DUF58 domain-containing protein [Turicibacter sp.]